MGFLTVIVYLIVSFIFGPFLVGIALDLIDLRILASYLEQLFLSDPLSKTLFLFIGITIVLFALRYLQALSKLSRKDKSITFESPEGNVSITLIAIEDMLKRMLEKRKEITNIKTKVILKKKIIEVNTKGVLNAEVNLIEFTKEIQGKVSEKMQSLLGESKEIKVNLIIKKLNMPNKGELIADAEEPNIPFREYE